MNDLAAQRALFDGVKPWSGVVPKGYSADFLGTLTDGKFRIAFGVDLTTLGGAYQETCLPVIGDGENGEGWFEAVNWLAAARDARSKFVMITLGAAYGAQAVGAYWALQAINPSPTSWSRWKPIPRTAPGRFSTLPTMTSTRIVTG